MPRDYELPSRNAQNKFRLLIQRVERMEQEGYSDSEIATFILQELHRYNLTLAQFEDWKAGYWSKS